MTELATLIQQLTPYMDGAPIVATAAAPPSPPTPPPPRAPRGAFSPRQQNSLIWCCYILSRGMAEYLANTAGGKEENPREELAFKMEWLDKMTSAPKKMKTTNHNITIATIDETKSNLISGKSFGVVDLISFCVYYEKNVMIAANKIYINIESHEPEYDSPAELLYYYPKTRQYAIAPPAAARGENLICIEQYNKLLRGISNYTVAELTDIATTRLGLDITKKTKKEIYEIICNEIAADIPPARGGGA